MLFLHLHDQGKDLFDYAPLTLAFVLSLLLRLLDLERDLILEILHVVGLDQLVKLPHLLHATLLLLPIDALLLVADLLAAEGNVVLLLRVSHDPCLKWSPLAHHFRCSSLNEFTGLAYVDHSRGFLALSRRLRTIGS